MKNPPKPPKPPTRVVAKLEGTRAKAAKIELKLVMPESFKNVHIAKNRVINEIRRVKYELEEGSLELTSEELPQVENLTQLFNRTLMNPENLNITTEKVLADEVDKSSLRIVGKDTKVTHSYNFTLSGAPDERDQQDVAIIEMFGPLAQPIY